MTKSRPELEPRLPRRIPSLDGLRAVAIVLVLIGHLAGTRGFPDGLGQLEHLGNYGVRCFFVISGFLITTLLLREISKTGRVSLRAFYLRRSLRILPASYVYIALIGLSALAGLVRLYPGDMLHSWTYTMNYQNISVAIPHARASGWYLNHLWSLSVEEQFYLCWPMALVLLGVSRSIKLAAMVVVAGPFVRMFVWHLMASAPEDVITTALARQFECVSDTLATGCLLAGMYNWIGEKSSYQKFLQSRYFLLAPILGIGLPTLVYLRNPVVFFVLSQSVINIAIAMCIERFVRYPSGNLAALLNAKPVVLIGVLSYSLYLWQEPFLNRYQHSTLFSFPINLLVVLMAASLSYYLVEQPFLGLKARLERKRLSAGLTAGMHFGARLLPGNSGRGGKDCQGVQDSENVQT